MKDTLDNPNIGINKKAEELITREQIENTPFVIVSNKTEGKHFGMVGKFRVTEPNENYEELKEELVELSWNRITQVIGIIVETELERIKTKE